MPGGGVSYLRASQAIREANFKGDERFGADILASALEAPCRQIASNAGFDGIDVVETLKEKKTATHGFNALTGEYGDMLKFGVLDPTKVARCAIQNAASIAGLMLTTNTLVTDLNKKDSKISGATA